MHSQDLIAHAATLAVALLCTVAVQLLVVRVTRAKVGVVMSLFVGFAAGLCVLLAGEILVSVSSAGSLADNIAMAGANLVLFICCWYFYFHFVNIGEASLRIRVLREAARLSGQPLSALLEVYNVRTVVMTRVERLVADGQLVQEGGMLVPGKPRMILVSKSFYLLRLLLLGQRDQKSNNV